MFSLIYSKLIITQTQIVSSVLLIDDQILVYSESHQLTGCTVLLAAPVIETLQLPYGSSSSWMHTLCGELCGVSEAKNNTILATFGLRLSGHKAQGLLCLLQKDDQVGLKHLKLDGG